MMRLLQKLETVSKSVIAIIGAGTAITGVLLGIYHGIYRLNQTASNIVKTLPLVENNKKFKEINLDYDILLAEKQLVENKDVDRILMRKLLRYKKELKLESDHQSRIDYLESKTKY